jgi:bile acid:Na+ symporter, BASS family
MVIPELIFTVFWAVSLTVALLFVAARMLAVGLGIEPADLAALRREPGFVARALLANFILVPALGVALAGMTWIPAQVSAAILLLAMVAGGVDFFAPTDKSDDTSVDSAALIFVLSLVSGLISPIVRLFFQPIGVPLRASFWRMVDVTALTVAVPLLVGVLIRWKAPAAARVLAKAMTLLATVLFVAVVLTTLLIKAPAVADIGAKGVVAMLILMAGAALAGWLVGGPSRERRALLARVTVMRNVGLSLLLAIVAFPDAGVDVAVLLFVVAAITARLLWRLAGWTSVPSMPAATGSSRKP